MTIVSKITPILRKSESSTKVLFNLNVVTTERFNIHCLHLGLPKTDLFLRLGQTSVLYHPGCCVIRVHSNKEAFFSLRKGYKKSERPASRLRGTLTGLRCGRRQARNLVYNLVKCRKRLPSRDPNWACRL